MGRREPAKPGLRLGADRHPGRTRPWAISLHLYNKKADVREKEAEELVRLIQGIPSTDYVVLGGDLNTVPRNEPAIQVLSAVVSEKAPPVDLDDELKLAVDEDDAPSTATNMTGKKNYDWVLSSPNLKQIPTTFSSAEFGLNLRFTNGLVFKSKRFASRLMLVPPGPRRRQHREWHATPGGRERLPSPVLRGIIIKLGLFTSCQPGVISLIDAFPPSLPDRFGHRFFRRLRGPDRPADGGARNRRTPSSARSVGTEMARSPIRKSIPK